MSDEGDSSRGEAAVLEGRIGKTMGKIEECRAAEEEIRAAKKGMGIYKQVCGVFIPQEKMEAQETIKQRLKYMEAELKEAERLFEEKKREASSRGGETRK
ncbi:MAG: uncharacterized protein A8A55_1704 [Amphiamblys sp. WSBS2006]|nr:MAG: uncharacterized protein A8A55_1704 [Amphiamblys sp. WSBS2006]